ncbi:ferrous iron transport protein A [Sphingomonas vulcanisoli]|uniref:Ferrous iron transport protein A n=1 Tax=Sphingomonas vulcanisoli TaxID=1658060 RepID=A0ABX0TR99_9SPHN|nr:FeoA family protein [Sphingomonas vulcanisoli]NIJ08042.1 ferrous iron transport protein A [Sphingomonas vulcanisoli]
MIITRIIFCAVPVLRLDQLPHRQASTISAIDWERLDVREARRLQELGFVEGVAIEALHRGPFKDPIACRVGTMTIALRRALAAAISVEPIAA